MAIIFTTKDYLMIVNIQIYLLTLKNMLQNLSLSSEESTWKQLTGGDIHIVPIVYYSSPAPA